MKPLNYINLRKIYPLLQSNSFPFLEKTFDDIDEYAILARLQRALLEIGENNNNLNDNFNELTVDFNNLKDYVVNYFKNLDVQDEIDNKLQQMANDGTLDTIINKYITNTILRIYETVSDMKSDTTLQEGMICKTLGFYSLGDNGASSYKISANLQPNESNIISLNNGLFAEFVTESNTINVKQFGCHEDDTTDDTDKLQNLINYADTNNFEITGNSKKLIISKTIFFSAYSVVKNLYLRAIKNGTYTNNFLISVNSINVRDWDIAYPLSYKGKFENLEIDNGSSNTDYNETLNCIYNAGNCQYKDILTRRFNVSFSSSLSYLDVVKLKNISVTHKIGSDFAINFGYLGDASEIDTAHTFENDIITNVHFINVGNGHKGCIIKNIINNGIMQILGSIVILENIHCEGENQIIIQNSDVNFTGGFFYHNSPNIKITNSRVNLSNIEFAYLLEDNSYENSSDIDVEIDGVSNVTMNNCYKIILANDINDKFITGIKTNISDNAYISLNRIYNSGTTSLLNKKYNLNVSNTSVAYPIASAKAKWFNDTNTYYYKFIPLLDNKRMITCNNYNATFNMQLTKNNSGFSVSAISSNAWRIYRGIQENNYNSYVDLGVIQNGLHDNGYMINGNKWNSRTAGDIDSVNTCYVGIRYIGDNIITYMTQLPSAGTWNTGDIIYNYNAQTGEDIGWICKLGGTPGTWISLGKVQ